MAENETNCCAICASSTGSFSPVPGTGEICSGCLLAGRFMGSTGAPRLGQAQRMLSDWSAEARELLTPHLEQAARLCEKQMHDAGRDLLLEQAALMYAAGNPLLSACLLQHCLGIPGSSCAVYAALGDSARAMDCTDESSQYYKTAGWLAMHEGSRTMIERVVQGLTQVAPDDPWLERARNWLAGENEAKSPLCGFCGKPASEVGQLIEGTHAAICGQCISKLAVHQKPSG